ncbi:lamina-associated polypeptide 2, isoforms beta/gamma isoform X1 [Oncorhynchus tshawytscha]|uniref:lamina-associated polypeptide 2, isoforms beta/gamma isoform X1 n=1 Tax=Oncorhynchus tshawytscha TaxID=74940 RepID=UPI000D09FC4E|nr:lamina-associated polypeptide 2, isoforms beta/gamma isoform X1 [Oncorhynchus tshawytscha]
MAMTGALFSAPRLPPPYHVPFFMHPTVTTSQLPRDSRDRERLPSHPQRLPGLAAGDRTTGRLSPVQWRGPHFYTAPASIQPKATRLDKPRSEEVKVTDLTDAGLKHELLKHGVSVGPIVGCTRILYEKKQLDTPAAEATPSLSETATVTAAAVKADGNQNGNTLSDQYSDKEEDEITAAPEPEPAAVVEKSVMSRGKTPVTIRTSSRRSNKVVDESLATGDQTPKKTGKNVEEILANEILSPIGISATCRRSIHGAAGRPVKPSNYWLNKSLLERSIYTESHSECSSLGSERARPGFLSVLLKLMVLITVAGSIYIVIQHLDADQVQSVKGLINDAKGHLYSTVDKVVDAVVDNVIVPLGIGASSSQSAGAEGGGK